MQFLTNTYHNLVGITIILLSLMLSGCHDEPEYDNTINGNFDLLWTTIDQHYCYLDEKNIDWDKIGETYRKEFKQEMTYGEFFDLCSRMLDELKDGHVNLSSNFNTSYYRQWWSDYPQDFNLRTLQENYLKFDYSQVGSLLYKILNEDVGYIYYGSFSSYVGETLMDNVLLTFKDCKCLIIDVRNNGGGELTNIKPFVSRFIDNELIAGYIRHKTGPGHNDFSEPYPIKYQPSTHLHWNKPVIVLTNRACFSAANDFVSVIKQLPNTLIIGAKTGGGGGLPFTMELPIGWSVRFSASPVFDANMNNIEFGIEPSEDFDIHSPAEQLAVGIDNILDVAIQTASSI